MNRQRGIALDLILYGIAAAAALGAIYGAYQYVNHSWETAAGISRGKEIKQGEWDAANAKAQAEAKADQDERIRLAGEQSKRLATAEGRARDADAKWRAARAAAARAAVPLVVADCPGPDRGVPTPAPGGGGLRLSTDLRFSYQFVREFQSGWSGPAGEPLFDYPLGPPEAPGSASPIDAEAVLANAAENASRCSANARQMNALIDLIERLRAR